LENQKRNRQIIKNEDFDRYIFQVSPGFVFEKNKKKILFDELQKRHPAFNTMFSIDTLFCVKKRKLYLDVIVINKIILADYKRKYRFSDFGFALENEKRLPCFINKKIFLGLLLLFIITLFAGIKITGNRKKELPVIELQKEVEIPVQNKGEQKYHGEDFFQIIESQNGTVDSFVWKTSFKEEITASVKNVFPESLAELSGVSNGNVKYSEQKPEFTFTGKWNKTAGKNSLLEVFDWKRKEIRKLLYENKIILIEEKSNPLRFSFKCGKSFYFFEQLEVVFKNLQIEVCEVSVRKSGDGTFFIEIELSEVSGESEGIPIGIINKYVGCFYTPSESKKENIVSKSIDEGLIQIGRIVYEDGNQTIFYKDSKNKIHKSKERK